MQRLPYCVIMDKIMNDINLTGDDPWSYMTILKHDVLKLIADEDRRYDEAAALTRRQSRRRCP